MNLLNELQRLTRKLESSLPQIKTKKEYQEVKEKIKDIQEKMTKLCEGTEETLFNQVRIQWY